MVAADTNVIVRLIVRDDPDQVAAAEAFIARGAWLSHLCLAEAVWVLASSYRFGREQIHATVTRLLEQPQVVLEQPDAVAAALATYGEHPSAGFTDCLALEIARKAGHVPLGTFDRGLAKVDGTVLLGRRR